MITMSDVIKQNHLQQAEEEKAHNLYSLERQLEQKILAENPHIGVLNGGARGNKFYSYQTGLYVESYNILDLLC